MILHNFNMTLCLQEIEEFVQSSGEHGIVVFSQGSVLINLTEEKASLIASALAQIPQKVSTTPDPGDQNFFGLIEECNR